MNHGSDRERVTSLSTLHTLKHVAIHAYRLDSFIKLRMSFSNNVGQSKSKKKVLLIITFKYYKI